MTKLDLINRLQKEIEESGNLYIRYYEVEAEDGGHSMGLLSPERKLKNGCSANMSWKEFKQYCIEERDKNANK